MDSWLVLRTKSRHENIVENILLQKQITAYLPKYKVSRFRQGRKNFVELPLFPGYVFVRPRIEQFETIRYIRGSCGFICTGHEPAKMPDGELEAIRELIDSGSTLSVSTELFIGQRIRIISGSLAGMEGELVCVKNQQMLVVNVNLLNSCVCVSVDRELIEVL